MKTMKLLLLTAALGAACAGQAQVTWDAYPLTNLPTAIASGGVSNLATLRISMLGTQPRALFPTFAVSNSVSGTVTYLGEATPFPVYSTAFATTITPWAYTVSANGTNPVNGLVSLPAATYPGWLWLTRISNGTTGTIFPNGFTNAPRTNYWVRGR